MEQRSICHTYKTSPPCREKAEKQPTRCAWEYATFQHSLFSAFGCHFSNPGYLLLSWITPISPSWVTSTSPSWTIAHKPSWQSSTSPRLNRNRQVHSRSYRRSHFCLVSASYLTYLWHHIISPSKHWSIAQPFKTSIISIPPASLNPYEPYGKRGKSTGNPLSFSDSFPINMEV